MSKRTLARKTDFAKTDDSYDAKILMCIFFVFLFFEKKMQINCFVLTNLKWEEQQREDDSFRTGISQKKKKKKNDRL